MNETIRLEPAKKIAAQIETLKQRVVTSLNGRSEQGYVLAVMSCESGEGVTSVATNFAALMAGAGDGKATHKERNVLLMEGNLGRPALHKIFKVEQKSEKGKESGNGTSEPVWQVYRAHKNLDVLLSRQKVDKPANVFEADWFNKSLRQLRERYDCVIVDSPPVNSSGGAVLLASKVDAVVLVVEAERLRWEVIQRTVAILEDAGTTILGVVLNRRRYPIPRMIYKML